MQAMRFYTRPGMPDETRKTSHAVFDQKDFAIEEDVQAGLGYGANEFHTMGLGEGLFTIFQHSIDRRTACVVT